MNSETHCKHTDPDPAFGLEWVASILGLSRPLERAGVQFDLRDWNGDERFAISIPWTEEHWMDAVRSRSFAGPSTTVDSSRRREYLVWLLVSNTVNDFDGADRQFQNLVSGFTERDFNEAAHAFVNANRYPWQPAPSPADVVLFEPGSDCNFWHVLWSAGGLINYRGHENGS